MCKCASFVITKGPKVWWLLKSDSHNDIIQAYKLHVDGLRGPNAVSVEISPDNDDLSLPINTWKYKVDQDVVPKWYNAEDCEKECRAELKAWSKAKLTGWKLYEAFHPINPLKIKAKQIAKETLLALMQEWASVRAGVRDSVGDSVRASVRDSVGVSVRDSVGDSVGDSVRDSVRDSVWDSVGYSAWDRAWDSAWDSVGAYIGGLFPNITEWKYTKNLGPDPWRPLLTLWYAGYVPSFDGTKWRLHAGKKAKIVLEWTP